MARSWFYGAGTGMSSVATQEMRSKCLDYLLQKLPEVIFVDLFDSWNGTVLRLDLTFSQIHLFLILRKLALLRLQDHTKCVRCVWMCTGWSSGILCQFSPRRPSHQGDEDRFRACHHWHGPEDGTSPLTSPAQPVRDSPFLYFQRHAFFTCHSLYELETFSAVIPDSITFCGLTTKFWIC